MKNYFNEFTADFHPIGKLTIIGVLTFIALCVLALIINLALNGAPATIAY
jgi:hypothetical protein